MDELKRGITILAGFLVIPVLVLVVLFSLPQTMFYLRPWEYLAQHRVASLVSDGPFYPNAEVTMEARGDLGRYSPYGIPRRVRWRTDAEGYRITSPGTGAPEIALFGDSFFAGSSLDEDETFGWALATRTGKHVITRASISSVHEVCSEQRNSPRNGVVLLSINDRNLRRLVEPRELPPRVDRDLPEPVHSALVFVDRQSKLAPLRFLRQRIRENLGEWSSEIFTGEETPAIRVGAFVGADGQTLFLDEDADGEALDDTEVEIAVATLVQIQRRCEAMGARFVFMPIPSKPTIDWTNAGLSEQPLHGPRIVEAATRANIVAIDLLPEFNRQSRTSLLYHPDDTHWNARGVVTAVDVAIDTMRAAQIP